MDKRLEQALIEQMNKEFESSYLYLSMGGFLDEQNWPGMAQWMYIQAEEERTHAMKIFKFLVDRGSFPKLLAIPEPEDKWDGPLDIFKAALAHEEMITASINQVMDVAMEVKDYAARGMLDWFVAEQIEEEAVAGDIVARMSRIADDPKGLLMLDNELGQRQAEPEGE